MSLNRFPQIRICGDGKMQKTFDEIVLFARTGLNPRQNFKLGQGNNKYITIKNIKNNTLFIDDNTDVIDDDAIKMIHKRSQIKKGDILFASIGRMGDMYIIESEPKGWDINESVFAFTLDTSIIRQKYFYYLFRVKSILNYLDSNSSGSTFKSIKMNQLKKMVFDIPSLDEQDTIINVLDRISCVIELKKQELDKLDELVKARFVEMFGDAENGESKYPIEILGNLSTKISDGVHAKPEYTEIGRPFLSVVNINQKKIDFTDCKFVSEEAYQKMIKSTKPEKGDVLYTKVGATYGIPAYVDTDTEFCLYVSVCLIKPMHEKINSRFLAIQMDTPFVKHQADKRIKGIGVPDLHLNQIREFQIICPPREMQDEFVHFVEQLDKSKVAVKKSLDEAQLLFDSLMQKYFG